jgi:hypothetical protein
VLGKRIGLGKEPMPPHSITMMMLGAASGAVAGLVAITPAAGNVGIPGAFVIGLAVGPLCFWGVTGLKKMIRTDDALEESSSSLRSVCYAAAQSREVPDPWQPWAGRPPERESVAGFSLMNSQRRARCRPQSSAARVHRCAAR